MMDSGHNIVKNNITTHTESTNETTEARGPVWCLYHTTTTHSDTHCRAGRRKWAGGNVHIAAIEPSRIKGIHSAYDFPEEDNQLELHNISFKATEVHPTASITAEKKHRRLGHLSASRRWPFEECAKPAISCGGREKPISSYKYGGTND